MPAFNPLLLPLTEKEINKHFKRIAPGNYMLGKIDAEGDFKFTYVGRSDEDLGERLRDHIGSYEYFKAAYADNAKQAFEMECVDYHDIRPLDNKAHPDRSAGSDMKCPCCKHFG
jgi:hypothetical protein